MATSPGIRACTGRSTRPSPVSIPAISRPAGTAQVDGTLATQGSARDSGGFDATLTVPKLGGRLRGRALGGHAELRAQGETYDGTIALSLDRSKLGLKGRVDTAPRLQWDVAADLDAFDPGFFAHGWDGAVDADLTSKGNARSGGGYDANVDLPRIGGRLRGRALQGHGRVAIVALASPDTATSYEGEVALGVGGSHIDAKGKVAQALDVDAKFSPLQLDDLLPDAAGSLRGTLSVSGARNAPDLAVDLAGSGLKYGGYTRGDARCEGPVAVERRRTARSSSMRSDANARRRARQPARRCEGRGRTPAARRPGARRDRRARLRRQRREARRQLAGHAGVAATGAGEGRGLAAAVAGAAMRSAAATGRCRKAASLPAAAARCAPAPTGRDAASASTARACRSRSPRPTCRNARTSGRGSCAARSRSTAQLRPAGNAWQGNVKLTSANGGLRLSERSRRDVISYGNLSLDADFNPLRHQRDAGERVQRRRPHRCAHHHRLGQLCAAHRRDRGQHRRADVDGTVLAGHRRADRQARRPHRARRHPRRTDAGRAGATAATSAPNCRRSASAAGRQRAHGRARRTAPRASAAACVPAADRRTRPACSTSTARWAGAATTRRWCSTCAARTCWSPTPATCARSPIPTSPCATPPAQPLTVTGTVTVPSALIDLERLDEGVSASPDVVVLDPVDPEAQRRVAAATRPHAGDGRRREAQGLRPRRHARRRACACARCRAAR